MAGVPWYSGTLKGLIHFTSKLYPACKSAFYKTVQVISDTLFNTKTPENAIFSPKKHSKNNVFASFFIKKHQKMHFFHLKTGVKMVLFVSFGLKLYHHRYILFKK